MQTIERNRKAHRGLAINGLITVPTFLYLAWMSFDSNVLWRIGLVGVLIFVAGLMFFLSINSWLESRKSAIALTIDEKGIDDNASFAEVGFMSWEKIEKVFIGKIHRKKHLIIQFKEGVVLEPTSNSFKRFGRKDVREKFGNAVAINGDYITGEVEEVLELILQESPLDKNI